MSTVQSLIESANPWQSQQGEAARLATKWAKSGLLEGLKDYDQSNMAVMLENQAKQLVVEQSNTGTGGTFTPGTGEQWAGVALPLVRKVFGQIASKEFVSVQPMSLPAGLVFFLDFQYGTTKNPFTSGQSLYGTPYNQGDSGFGNLAQGGLYGAGRWGYSVNQFSSSLTGATSVAGASFDQVNWDSNYSASVSAGQISQIAFTTGSNGFPSNFDVNGIRDLIFTSANGTTVSSAMNLPQFATISGGTVKLYVSASVATATGVTASAILYWNKKTADNARGDFENQSGGGYPNSLSNTEISIPEINVQLRSETIAAKTRKLKAQWTPEFAQDLNAYQNSHA